MTAEIKKWIGSLAVRISSRDGALCAVGSAAGSCATRPLDSESRSIRNRSDMWYPVYTIVYSQPDFPPLSITKTARFPKTPDTAMFPRKSSMAATLSDPPHSLPGHHAVTSPTTRSTSDR